MEETSMQTTKIIRTISLITALLGSALAAPIIHAQEGPTGLWRNIDDKTGKSKALIRITEINGELEGKIEKIFREPSEDQNPKCVKCDGANKDKPIIGLTIMTGLKKDDDEYTGGKILDPDNGILYSCKLKLIEQNKKLKVRGFVGLPLLGRSQIWVREPQ
jgi:uncharacterized protein (DUF2147 family)